MPCTINSSIYYKGVKMAYSTLQRETPLKSKTALKTRTTLKANTRLAVQEKLIFLVPSGTKEITN